MTLSVVLLTFISAAGLWGLYLMYVALHASMKNGKFQQAPKLVQGLSYFLLVFMVTADVLFNVVFGSFLFLELPSVRALTFTARCSGHLKDDNWRGDLARWVCEGWLNIFEENHCR